MTLTPACPGRSVVRSEAVDAVQLLLFVWEAGEAHRGLGGAAAPPRPRDGVADAAVLQPARVAAVIAQKLPGGEHLAHFRNPSTIAETSLHRFVVGQLGGVDQVVEAACGEEERGQWAGVPLSRAGREGAPAGVGSREVGPGAMSAEVLEPGISVKCSAPESLSIKSVDFSLPLNPCSDMPFYSLEKEKGKWQMQFLFAN